MFRDFFTWQERFYVTFLSNQRGGIEFVRLRSPITHLWQSEKQLSIQLQVPRWKTARRLPKRRQLLSFNTRISGHITVCLCQTSSWVSRRQTTRLDDIWPLKSCGLPTVYTRRNDKVQREAEGSKINNKNWLMDSTSDSSLMRTD